jgi:hypothetical protein
MNPHQQGHHLVTTTAKGQPSAYVRWSPVIPEAGEYAVYVSYNAAPDRATDAHYIINHAGGRTDYRVNQQICGNYWVYIGHFKFPKGMNPDNASVILANDSEQEGATISADCIKFGGGMGDVTREGTISGYPRFLEGARYWLQYAGVQPDMVYKLGFDKMKSPDYVEDYSARGEWVNFLNGAPSGPNPNRDHPGLGVPIDLSIGFHTDAGIKDGVVGTLLIYRLADQKKQMEFPDGRSRWLSRDLADLIQTQIVSDIRALFSSSWRPRQVRNGDYSETRRPNVPSVIIELLSHQNFDDMKYGLDPRFKFTVARAIYKAVLRFIAYEYGYEPVITPLSPKRFMVKASGPGKVVLGWVPQSDPLEPTAEAEGYIVYMRKGADADFDNGSYLQQTACEIGDLDPNEIYSFKVVAVNKGGISFPTESLSVRTGAGSEPKALIVNAFDRIAPPEFFESETFRGATRAFADKGVGYKWMLDVSGDQWDFDDKNKFLNNDNPGWGASYGDQEKEVELGNNFDYTVIHGAAINAAGWAFDSCSDEAVREGMVTLSEYRAVDWLLGEERTTPPPPWRMGPGAPDKMDYEFQALTPEDQKLITDYLNQGGGIFISGAYVGTDLAKSTISREGDKKFLGDVLQCEWTTNNGSKTNNVAPVPGRMFDGIDMASVHFSQGVGEKGIYGVELPDSLRPAKNSTALPVLRYEDAYFNAAIAFDGPVYKTVVFGFPFETIINDTARTQIMARILDFLVKQ